MKHLRLALLLICSGVLAACGGGFETVKPDPDQIVSIRNLSFTSRAIDPKDAEPIPLPDGPPLPDLPEPDDFVLGTPTVPDNSKFPWNTYGWLTSTAGRCTAQLVGEGDVLMTAGHCVYDTKRNIWSDRFTFYRGYKNGSYGESYNWECAAIFSGWAQNAYRKDYAFIKLRGKWNQTPLGLSKDPFANAISGGYPVNFENGQRLHIVDGTIAYQRLGVVEMKGNPFKQGSSGGAWVVQQNPTTWFAVGLNSFGYDNRPNSMFGPQFDAKTIELYEFVRRDCQQNVFPMGRDPKIATYDRAKAIIAADPSEVVYGPALVTRRSQKCTCPGSEEYFVENKTKSNYDLSLRFAAITGDTARVLSDEDVGVRSLRDSPDKSLGCTIGQINGLQCDIALRLKIQSMRRRIDVFDAGKSTTETITPAFCEYQCINNLNAGYCRELGKAGKPVLAQIAGFLTDTLDRPPNSDGVTTTKSELIQSFGGDPKQEDPCTRSDFYKTGEVVSNSGLACSTTTPSVTDAPQEARLNLRSPPRALATRLPNRAGIQSVAAFEERPASPLVEFFTEDGAGADDLNDAYGGKLVHAMRSNGRLIVTTEHGCVVGDDK